jgi:hypothetical protein
MRDFPWTSGVQLLFHNAPGEDDPPGFPRGAIEFAKAVRYVMEEAPPELRSRFTIHFDYGTLAGAHIAEAARSLDYPYHSE